MVNGNWINFLMLKVASEEEGSTSVLAVIETKIAAILKSEHEDCMYRSLNYSWVKGGAYYGGGGAEDTDSRPLRDDNRCVLDSPLCQFR
ncbi:hypothetical protein AND_004936 [Anopheles darlingi]|uniref:Uncharacterized protein n=1 Tax=Anopheles darlingi TaxID=43151 RepID=W5JJB1_ANODA|nr:hypothetical protein AND_004936 [Anopheles darlingi]